MLQSHGLDWRKKTELKRSDLKATKELKIKVQNRETGKLEEEKIPNYIRVAMRMMYSTGGGLYSTCSQGPSIQYFPTIPVLFFLGSTLKTNNSGRRQSSTKHSGFAYTKARQEIQ